MLSFMGCATLAPIGLAPERDPIRPPPADAAGAEIAQTARDFVGRTNMRVAGERFLYDCSGTILAIHYAAGIDLRPEFAQHSGNGVRRLYAIARERGLVHNPALPEVGDIIFWDNTFDRNGDGLWNDELTHAGIVVAVRSDGSIDYVHHNYRRGIVLEHMNVATPDVHLAGATTVNSPMRMRSPDGTRAALWSAAHLYRAAGSVHGL